MDPLRAATIWPAEFLGLSESSGSVAVGKRADLVLFDALLEAAVDPCQNPQTIREVGGIGGDGVRCGRGATMTNGASDTRARNRSLAASREDV